ncbi:uncharacterized protein LOC132549643 [Ylistrum balloti]|uniref:uncharacterized protein LOC132549643 n=1 Tax=Ylistrum balloti TaxID=509963 RepID=UPI0029059685|nr:uncharacterized protein LOC132549643 [Ylistrum balloti]
MLSTVGGLLALVMILTHTSDVHAQCTMIDTCSCFMPDGNVVDITSLGDNNGFAKFFAIPAPDNFYYSLNLCYPFNEGSCAGAAGCQTSPDFTSTYQIGDSSTAMFSTDASNNVHVIYTSPADDGRFRTVDVTLLCDANAIDPTIQVLGEQGFNSLLYAFTITSHCACPGACSLNPNPIDPGKATITVEAGISAGTVLCIIAIVGIIVYVGGGMTYMKVKKQATGTGMIPNKDFWTAIPGLIKEGAVFTYQKIRGKISGKQYSAI